MVGSSIQLLDERCCPVVRERATQELLHTSTAEQDAAAAAAVITHRLALVDEELLEPVA